MKQSKRGRPRKQKSTKESTGKGSTQPKNPDKCTDGVYTRSQTGSKSQHTSNTTQ